MTAAELLSEHGPLARQVPGFAVRPQQQQMAAAVENVVANSGVLIAEAGTGTGKTYAYLIPALASGKKVIISTAARNLQEQLFHRDLPLVRRALEKPLRIALLKGRSNYLCLHRLESLNATARGSDPDILRACGLIYAWAGRTRRGDIAEVAEVPEQAPIWSRVTSTADNCLGAQCPHIENCFLVKARRRAQEADVVVINHHLFFADMTLKQEGFGEVLPNAEIMILDEAHQLPELAGYFFGISISSRQLAELARDAVTEHQRDAPDAVAIAEAAEQLQQTVAEMLHAFGGTPRRGDWQELASPALSDALAGIRITLAGLQTSLEPAAERGRGLAHCWQRCQDQQQRLQRLCAAEENQSEARWFEARTRSFILHLTPLRIAPLFEAHMRSRQAAWIFTSATLAVAREFEHFATRLGLMPSATLCLESPFDYQSNALLYQPEGMPDPASAHYVKSVVDRITPVLSASGGRAFVLFTSHRALQQAAAIWADRLPYPLLVQGSLPRNELLERFRQLGNAVLLGAASFWEGIDVRGEALSCVIITKLPFAAPSDPVTRARLTALRRQGQDPFTDYQLPQAVLALKQGAGRLIRDIADRGVLVICDPRLQTRRYGRVFLDSLPPMSRTAELEQVQRFFLPGRLSPDATPISTLGVFE